MISLAAKSSEPDITRVGAVIVQKPRQERDVGHTHYLMMGAKKWAQCGHIYHRD